MELSRSQRIALVSSAFCFLLGLLVLIGWKFGLLILLNAGFEATMSAKTAVAFMFAAVGLVLCTFDARISRRLICSVPLMLIVLTAIESLPFDNLWFNYVAPLVKHPDFRHLATAMALHTAIVFFLCSLAVAIPDTRSCAEL
jgi:hypothetical protein